MSAGRFIQVPVVFTLALPGLIVLLAVLMPEDSVPRAQTTLPNVSLSGVEPVP